MFFKIVTILAKLDGAFGPEVPITKAKSMAFSVNQNDEKGVQHKTTMIPAKSGRENLEIYSFYFGFVAHCLVA